MIAHMCICSMHMFYQEWRGVSSSHVEVSAESHLGLLDTVVHSVKKLCEGEVCCLEHKRKDSALRLLYKIYHRADHLMNKI